MSLLEMSLSGAVMILVIVVIRALVINRLPKKTFLALWGITLMRLFVPYSVPSAFSVYSLFNKLLSPAKTEPLRTSDVAVQPANLLVPGTGVVSSASTASAASLAVPPYRLVWMVGALVCAAFFTATYLRCRREFREALPVDCNFAQDWLKEHRLYRSIRLRQSDRISAPLTYGVFRPVILLPKHINWDDKTTLAYVLTHEYIHIRRFDAVTKMVLVAAFCIHWFNPAVWVMYVLANRDLELSCDEAVIRLFGERTKSAYAMTLIRMEEKRSGLQPLCNNFSKHAIEERIIAIMKIKKTSLVAVIVAVALVAGVTTAFATSGQATAQGAGGNGVPAQNSADTFTFQGTLGMDAKNAKFIADSKWFPDYEQHGLSYDAQQGVLSYHGQLISFFHDETAPGVYTHVNFSQGTVGIEVKRNADWEIVGLVEYSTWADDVIVQEGFSEQTSLAADVTIQEGSLEQTSVIDRTISSTDFYEPTRDELLAEYGKFGISFDISGKMLYQNKPVRWFADFVELEEGALATRYVYRNDEGTEYIHTVRNRTSNGDGSYDPFGPLLEIVPWETGERDDYGFLFQGSQINATSESIGNDNVDGTTFEERFSKYKDFGITYVEADGASGRGNVYLNGSLVSRFADVAPDGSTFSFTSAETGGMIVHTEYDSHGNLIGVQEMLSYAVEQTAKGQ